MINNSLHPIRRRGSLLFVKSLAVAVLSAAALVAVSSLNASAVGGEAGNGVCPLNDCTKQGVIDYEFAVYGDRFVLKAAAAEVCEAAHNMAETHLTETQVIASAVETYTDNGWIVTPEGVGHLVDLLAGCIG